VLLGTAIGLIIVSAMRADRLARQQMEFVAAVSHELRTPVSVIGAAAGNLADGVVGEAGRVKKYGATIQGEARCLAETVERVLQLAGIAAGRAATTPVPVAPADLVADVLDACRAEIDAADLHVEIDVPQNLPAIAGDPMALKAALQNLVSNATKHGRDGKWMRVSAQVTPAGRHVRRGLAFGRPSAARPFVEFVVEDRGPGLLPADRKHVFEPFYRGRDAVAKQIPGSGLGLNLVHRIAEAHGGTVHVSSEAGHGARFTLRLPAMPELDIQGAPCRVESTA
jgi:signal transduction histidine kinase